MYINIKQEQRVLRAAHNTILICKAIRRGRTAQEIQEETGANQSVVRYYIKLLTEKL